MRVWTEINLDSIAENLATVRRLAPECAVMAVVKADAYGHGAAVVAPFLQDCGVEMLAVASLDEAAELRAAGVTIPIINLGYATADDVIGLLSYEVSQTVYDAWQGRELASAAAAAKGVLTVHFKVDTGMSRLGFVASEGGAAYEIAAIAAMPGLNPEGMFTHFATSEVDGDSFQAVQLQLFEQVLDTLGEIGLEFRYVHASNSGGIINIPDAHFNMVRPGIMLYGVSPVGEAAIKLRPAAQLRARLARTHLYPGPVSVSYGRTFQTNGMILTGTVTIGYADGLHRSLSNRMEVLVRGKRVRQIGNICMDMMVVDLSTVPDAEVGDEVTIYGTDGDQTITVQEVAELAGTIPYEIMCAPSRRVTRIVT